LSLIHISAVYDQLHAHYNFIVVQSQSVQWKWWMSPCILLWVPVYWLARFQF
jgi:hypothetical protein